MYCASGNAEAEDVVLLKEFSAEERIKRWWGFKATDLQGL